jgi:hypothetical protein
VDVIKVSDEGLVATLYLPSASGRHPAVIVLSGSEGGIAGASMYGEPLASLGYATLALAYFAMDGLPDDLVEIPLEYFKRAIDWLRARADIDGERIALLGHSRGGEAALLIASTYQEIRLVVANVPSHVVWNGAEAETGAIKSAFSLRGVGVPFLPLIRRPDAGTVWRDLFAESLRAASPDQTDASIPVERINGPILFITGTDDGVWPCGVMVESAIERLRGRGFAFEFEHANYPDAGHAILMPPYHVGPIANPWPAFAYRPPTWREQFGPPRLGGTPEGNRLARIDAWPRMVRFIGRHLSST